MNTCDHAIDNAVADDVAAMRAIYNRSVETETASFDLEPLSAGDYRRWFDSHAGRFAVLAVKHNGVVLGYASLSPFNPKPAFAIAAELSVYIAEAHRRRGLAAALLSAILAEARRGPLKTVVSLITANNTGSIRLHEKLGFRQVGTLHRCGEKFGQVLDVAIFEIDVSSP